jgi:glycosyltransferase involved in cell wall biosynthesis
MAEPDRRKRIALLFAQFSAYHVDRCEAVAKRLSGRCEVLAVEVATSSATYAWEPSGAVAGARKLTLFPGQSHDSIPALRRFWAQLRALRRCHAVFVGVGYNEPDIVLLSWVLRLHGIEVIALSESKFDDKPRRAGFELFKALLLSAYSAAIVGGRRQVDYFRYLGFSTRRVLPGYDTVGLARIRAMGGAAALPFAERPFLFVGRFVDKKNLPVLLEGYAAYVAIAGKSARRLQLAGSGPDEAALRAQTEALGLSKQIDFLGFLDAAAVARAMASALALVLPSREEQWGLVVNEALAFGLPVIVSTEVGARDALVRNLLNGYVLEPGSVQGLALAMTALAGAEALWQRMSAASHERAWLGDAERFADAVELVLDLAAGEAAERVAAFETTLAEIGSRRAER